MSTPFDANKARKDFELAMLFGIEGIPSHEECLSRGSNGQYHLNDVQAAWLGYLARASHEHAMRERLKATRYICNGDRTHVRELMTCHLADGFSSDDENVEQFVRAILKHFEGMPT